MTSVNSKILMAFMGGALIASGIVFIAVRPDDQPKPIEIAAVQPKPVAPAPIQQAEAPPAKVDSASPPVTAESPVPPPPATHEKPSPLRAPVHRENPIVVARRVEPQQQSAPTTVPEPKAAEPAPAPQPTPVPQPVPAPPVEQQPTPSSIPEPVQAPATLPPQQETPAPPPAAPEPPTRVPNTVTIQSGTTLAVRIGETISAGRNETGDTFLATLERPLVIDGFVIAERGARVEGRVVEAEQAGKVKGASHLTIELVRLSTSDGQRIRIRTEPFKKEGVSSTGSDLAKIGAGAAIGAAIGAAAGGGKGAAIGAGIGGAAGTADVLLTRGKPAEIPVETRISFRIQEPLTITERLEY